jgi:uncharacterized protein YndB with AHSA1/START domain
MTESAQQTPTALVERDYDHPAQAVFDAWTNPEVIRRFWHAGPDWETPVAEVDLRVGGAVRVVMRTPDGTEYGGGGEFTEIVPPRRLAFTWHWDDDSPQQTSLIELTFEERDGATKVVLSHSGLPSDESARNHTDGWQQVLDNLATKGLGA